MRTLLLRFCTLTLVAVILLACTRDRATPEATATVPGAPAAATKQGEPAVETTTKKATPTPDTAAEPTATPTPAASTRGTMDYTVAAGDTLADIAARFNTEVQTLRELNFLLDDNILAGQVLSVPEGEPTPTPAPFRYTVQPGDSVFSIAAQFGLKPITLIEINNIEDPNTVQVGTELLIPGYQQPAAAEPAGDAATTAAGTQSADSTESTAAAASQVTHVVQPGETLGTIAADYGVAAAAIAQANGLTNDNLIRVGQELVIPGISSQEALAARSQRHVVQSGESLSTIAQKYGVSVAAIMAANDLSDPNKIVVGQELLIPPGN